MRHFRRYYGSPGAVKPTGAEVWNVMQLLFLVLLLQLVYSCAKINVWEEPPDHPVIDSIAPSKGRIGTQIRIYGTGFSYNSSENAVKVNGVSVRVDSPSSSTVVLATITSVTGTGNVNLTVNNNEAIGPVFTYDENAVSINNITPRAGWVDTIVVIRGVGFGTQQDSVQVYFDNTAATILQFSDSLIKVKAPDALNQNPGTVQVTVKGGSRTSNGMPYAYQHRPVITNVTKNYWQPGDNTYYFISVDNLAGADSANKLFVNGNAVAIDSIFRSGTPEYNFTPVGEKIFVRETNADQGSISLLDFVVSAYGISSSPYHFINDPVIQDIISLHNFPSERRKTGPGDTLEIAGRYLGTSQSGPVAELWDSTSPLVSSTHYLPDPTILSWTDTDIKLFIPTTYTIQPDTITMILKLKQNGKEADAYIKYIQQGSVVNNGSIYELGITGNSYVYWKDGIMNAIPGCKNAKDMFVSGQDVYIAGEQTQGSGSTTYASYWKNGSATNLTDAVTSLFSSKANSVFVAGNDIYVAGTAVPASFAHTAAVYWKNGTLVAVSDGTRDAQAMGIFVQGNDVYVSGVEINPSTGYYAVAYWKNGVRVNCTDGTQSANMLPGSSITVSGNDVYLAGSVVVGFTPPNIYHQVSAYWKNGTQVNVSSPAAYAVCTSVAVADTNVYLAGQIYATSGSSTYSLAVLWKNGTETDLTSIPESHALANSVFLTGTDVYIAGTRNDLNVGGYWKNGVFNSNASSITILKVLLK